MPVRAGFGSTVTVTVNGSPEQLPDFGVTVYIAVCEVFVGFVRDPLIFAALVPAAPPRRPPDTAGAAHVYVVAAGTIPSVPSTGIAVKLPVLHTVAVIGVIAGFGSTVIVTVNVAPVQLPDFGVTVYVAVCRIFVGLLSIPLIFAAFVPVAPPVNPPVMAGNPHE
jgi:uncharacterized membrane protein